MAKTAIEYGETAWNPVTGCSHSGSPGCDHCWAKRMAQRHRGRFGYPSDNPFRPTVHKDRRDQPYKWRKPRVVLVSFMGDLFHNDISELVIQHVLRTALTCRDHQFVFLTKRWSRMADSVALFMNDTTRRYGHDPPVGDYIKHLYFGVSVCTKKDLERAYRDLTNIKRAMKRPAFLSIEPMLEEMNVTQYIHRWLISGILLGGESGPGARPIDPEWARRIRDQCDGTQVPFFFKQWGGVQKKKTGRILDGRTHDSLPWGQG